MALNLEHKKYDQNEFQGICTKLFIKNLNPDLMQCITHYIEILMDYPILWSKKVTSIKSSFSYTKWK